MDGILTGIVNDLNIAAELQSELSQAGYYEKDISIITEDSPASSGPLQAIPIPDVPQELMSYGASDSIANSYYEQMEGDYVLIAVGIYQHDAENIEHIFTSCGAKDIHYISR